MRSIKWRDIQIGDEFVDGSKVTGISPVTYKPCVIIKAKDNIGTVVSEDHLIEAFVCDFDGDCLNDNFHHSKMLRSLVLADYSFVSAKDLLDSFEKGLDISLDEGEIEYIKPYKNEEPQECFCITTDTGVYTVNGLVHHNTARLLFYAMADVEVIDDCGNESSDGVLHCKAPGVCKKCAAKSGWDVEKGQLVGATISTHLTEGLTQAYLSSIHTGTGKKQNHEVIRDTMMGFASSPIIQEAKEKETTEERRQVIFDGLKTAYSDAGIAVDDYNVEMIAKRLTQYKRDGSTGELRFVKDDEVCSFASLNSIGGHNNLFLQSELRNSYDKITRPQVFDNPRSAFTEIAQ